MLYKPDCNNQYKIYLLGIAFAYINLLTIVNKNRGFQNKIIFRFFYEFLENNLNELNMEAINKYIKFKNNELEAGEIVIDMPNLKMIVSNNED